MSMLLFENHNQLYNFSYVCVSFLNTFLIEIVQKFVNFTLFIFVNILFESQ